jgi:ABC-type uncharacterized transport system substrate-binding protein
MVAPEAPKTAQGPASMIDRFLLLALAACASLAFTMSKAAAHPHVWVTIKSELVYAPDGSVTGVRHAWTFDDMFSAFATQGLESKVKGAFTREELKPLAEVNVTSLKEYDFFTYAKADGKKSQFNEPVDYYLEYKDALLTLHFTLPFKTPVKAKNLDLAIYDDSFFVDFTFAEQDAAALVGAPAQCKLTVARPNDTSALQSQRLELSRIPQSESLSGVGAQFASRLTVTCQ